MACVRKRRDRWVIDFYSSIMKYAAHPKRGYAPYNPASDVENNPKRIKREADTATVEEAIAIIQHMPTIRDKLMVITKALGGLRLGELFGLQWHDIQWEDSQVFIRRTFNHGEFYPPKTNRSENTVDLDRRFLGILREWRKICPNGTEHYKDILSWFWGNVWDPSLTTWFLPWSFLLESLNNLKMVFPAGDGRPMDSTSWVRRVWHPARKAADLRYLTPKSLRHFSGSFLLDHGESVGYVQDHLRHSSSTMTMDVYRHKMKKYNERAAQSLGDAFSEFFNLNGSKMVAESRKGANHTG